MDVSGSTTAFESLPKPRTAALTQFPSEPQPLERRAAGGLEADRPFLVKRTKPVGATPTEILFGSYRVLPTQTTSGKFDQRWRRLAKEAEIDEVKTHVRTQLFYRYPNGRGPRHG